MLKTVLEMNYRSAYKDIQPEFAILEKILPNQCVSWFILEVKQEFYLYSVALKQQHVLRLLEQFVLPNQYVASLPEI